MCIRDRGQEPPLDFGCDRLLARLEHAQVIGDAGLEGGQPRVRLDPEPLEQGLRVDKLPEQVSVRIGATRQRRASWIGWARLVAMAFRLVARVRVGRVAGLLCPITMQLKL
eukprot:2846534-Pyramimonas_sp.AAC.1